MNHQDQQLAIVTGASSGIGFELAKCCAAHGFDLIIAADEAAIHQAAAEIAARGAHVEAIEADLATQTGVDALVAAVQGRPVAALLANAGRGLGRAFLDQNFHDIRRVIDTNVTGTLDLVQRIGREMRARREGKILITGSIAGFMPGTYQAVYNGTKALLDSFSFALRAELKDTGVSVTCLMPGATETEFFERADMLDTKVGTQEKQSAEEVARLGFEAMMNDEGRGRCHCRVAKQVARRSFERSSGFGLGRATQENGPARHSGGQVRSGPAKRELCSTGQKRRGWQIPKWRASPLSSLEARDRLKPDRCSVELRQY